MLDAKQEDDSYRHIRDGKAPKARLDALAEKLRKATKNSMLRTALGPKKPAKGSRKNGDV
jgi:hypothetical protein